MNFKKTIAKSLVVAMALGMVPVANLQTAKAAQKTVKFDGATGLATSEGSKFWGIAKEDKANGKGSVKIGTKSYKISNIQEYADGIDAYAALKGKAGIIVAGEKSVPDGDWGVLELPAAESTFKVYVAASTAAVKGFTPTNKYGGEYGYLFASVGKPAKSVDLSASGEAIEVKLNEGKWQKVKEFFGNGVDDSKVTAKLKMLSQNGSTLTFRVMGTTTAWASKESKVKVATQPKAPNVKVDITKETTSIKNGMEYKVVDTGTAADGVAWKVATDKKGLSFTDLALVPTKGSDVYVRTAASAKKLASAVTKVTVNKGATALSIPALNATSATIADTLRVESNVQYDITKGASLYNIGKDDLEWALVGTDGKYKWSTLKASKDPAKKPTKVALKYSATAKANTWGVDGVKLALRRSGVKQDKNGVATQSGVSATAVMALKNVDQKFTFASGAGGASGDIEVTNATTLASIKVTTGTAATYTIKGKVTNFVGTKAGTAKVKKVKDLPKGITYKVGKIDPSGDFEITVNVGKLKDKITETTAEFSFEFQGIKSGFKIKVSPK